MTWSTPTEKYHKQLREGPFIPVCLLELVGVLDNLSLFYWIN